jgi:hypothetical protein
MDFYKQVVKKSVDVWKFRGSVNPVPGPDFGITGGGLRKTVVVMCNFLTWASLFLGLIGLPVLNQVKIRSVTVLSYFSMQNSISILARDLRSPHTANWKFG